MSFSFSTKNHWIRTFFQLPAEIMFHINKALFPVKMHYFFFLAAMGPILPFYPLVGKQLGLSEAALGSITAVFPLLYLILKPCIGFLADYYYHWRKVIFLGFIIGTCLSFNLLATIHDSVMTVHCDSIKNQCSNRIDDYIEKCSVKCGGSAQTSIISKLNDGSLCFGSNNSFDFGHSICCHPEYVADPDTNHSVCHRSSICALECSSSQFHLSHNFWFFTILTSLGCIFYNITNFYSDAICFDVLGDGNEENFGRQRVWGTIGFGITALLGGYGVDLASKDLPYKNFIPIFVLASGCILMDLFFSWKLKLPQMSKSDNIIKDVWSVVGKPRVALFLLFATFVGIMDSSIFYYLLWYIEDLAVESGSVSDIKLLQGLTVALETLVGETISFFLSGWIIKKIGYAHSLSLGFIFYSLRLGLLASISEPWLVLPIEGLLQGPSFALVYSTIVVYASSVTPPGTSGTIQGLVAGMDDGLGISIGSLIGGFIYNSYNGRVLYISYSCVAFVCALIHFLIHTMYFRKHLNISPDMSKTYHLAVENEVEMKTLRAAIEE